MMEDKCKNCRYCAKLYVPPLKEYSNIPNNSYLCTVFWDNKESNRIMYLGDNQGMCEIFTEKK